MAENNNAALSLEERFALLEAQYNKVTEESAAKDSIIATQDDLLAAANAQGAGSLSVVVYDKQRYQVLAGQFSLDGKVIQHHELKSKPELLKKIVEEYPGLVQLLEEPKAEADADDDEAAPAATKPAAKPRKAAGAA